MKKTAVLLSIILAINFIFAGCNSSSGVDSLKIDMAKSAYVDFDYDDETNVANIYYNFRIENKSDKKIEFYVKGDFEADVEAGLIKHKTLYACTNKDEKRVCVLEPKSVKTMMLEFVDDFGGTEERKIKDFPTNITFELAE